MQMFPFHLQKKNTCYVIWKIELNWTHQMIIKKQCYPSDDFTAALSWALSPRHPVDFFHGLSPLWSRWGLSVEKSHPESRGARGQGRSTLCLLREHGVDELIKKRKRKNPNLGPNTKHALFFLLFFSFWSSILFPLLFYFYFFCFYLCPSCFQQGLEVLKTLQKDISNRDWSRKHDLWTSAPLMHYH